MLATKGVSTASVMMGHKVDLTCRKRLDDAIEEDIVLVRCGPAQARPDRQERGIQTVDLKSDGIVTTRKP